jgi:hypothetical protein
MLTLNKSTSVETPEAAIVGAGTDEQLFEKNTVMNEISKVTAREWFALGNRVPYDRRAKEILQVGDTTDSADVVHVFRRITKDATLDANVVWTSFLPGWPDGSFGWAKVDQHLTGKNIGPRLFVEYVGHGDSDIRQTHQNANQQDEAHCIDPGHPRDGRYSRRDPTDPHAYPVIGAWASADGAQGF